MALVVGVAGPPLGIILAGFMPNMPTMMITFFGPSIAACALGLMALKELDESKGAVRGGGIAVLGIFAAIAWVGLNAIH